MLKRNAASAILVFGLAVLSGVLIGEVVENLPTPVLTDKQLLTIGYNSTAKIEVEVQDLWTGELLKGHGTGFVISVPSREYLFITNAHVCHSREAKLSINLHGGADVFPAKVLRFDEDVDLCVLEPTSQLNHRYLTPLPLSTSREIGSLSYVVGYPRQAPLIPSFGSVVAFEYAISPIFVSIILSNRVYAGNSGSPILNNDQQVIGIAEAADNQSNQGLGIPSSYLVELIKGL